MVGIVFFVLDMVVAHMQVDIVFRRFIQRGAHGGNMVGSRSAAAADNGSAEINQGRHAFSEVLRAGWIEDAAADHFGESGIGHG